jgi:hypothetical protein
MNRYAQPGEPDYRAPIAQLHDALIGQQSARVTVRTDRWYADLAAAYVEAVDADKAYAPTLAAQFSYTNASIRTAVNQARNLGFLTQTSRGRPGGELTAKARQVLEQES